MNRQIAMGRGLTENDERRRSTVAVVGATLGSKLFGGADPVGRDITVEGVRFRVVGVQASSQIFNEELWYDANGITIPLQTYMDRIDPDHKLSHLGVKLARTRELDRDVRELVLRVHAVHVGLERDQDAVGVVPELLVEDLARRLHADDAEGHALDHDVAADRVGAAEELGGERRADHRHRRAPALVVLGDAAAEADRPVHQRA